MVNFTNFTALPDFTGTNSILLTVIAAALVVIGIYIVLKVVKSLIINAIMGGIGLIILNFFGPMVGLDIPLTMLNIVVALVAGIPGLVILILLAVMGL